MSDKTYLEWPFFEARHAALERRLDEWAALNIEQHHGADVDDACRRLVRRLGDGGWLRHAVAGVAHGGEGDAIDTRAICLIRETLARELAAGPTFAHGMTKKCLEQEWSMGIAEAIEAEAQAQAICMQTEDFKRAYEAFAAKRKPVFAGD